MNGIKLFPPLNTSSKLVHDDYDRRRRSIEFFMNIFNLPKDAASPSPSDVDLLSIALTARP